MELITHILAFLAGLGTAYSIRFIASLRVHKESKSNSVVQQSNQAGGDIVAGNSTKVGK